MNQENYLYRKDRLIRSFDKSLSRVKPWLDARLNEQRAERFIEKSHQEYEALIPSIPFIGRNNRLLVFFLPTTRYLAVYRALQKQGLAVEDAGALTIEMGTAEITAIPAPIRWFIGYLWFSSWLRSRIEKRAEESKKCQYHGDYVLDFVEGDGREFDYGVDYVECASCKFLEAENAMELAPYVCAVDKAASDLMGWGLTRTTTLADGFPRCDFRFKKGGETRVALPQSLS